MKGTGKCYGKGSTINDLGGPEEKSKMNLFFPRRCLLKFIFSRGRPLERRGPGLKREPYVKFRLKKKFEYHGLTLCLEWYLGYLASLSETSVALNLISLSAGILQKRCLSDCIRLGLQWLIYQQSSHLWWHVNLSHCLWWCKHRSYILWSNINSDLNNTRSFGIAVFFRCYFRKCK